MNLHLPDSEEASTSVPPTFTLALALLGWYLAKRDTQIGARSPQGPGLVPFTHRMGGAFVFFPPFLNVLGALLGLKKKKTKTRCSRSCLPFRNGHRDCDGPGVQSSQGLSGHLEHWAALALQPEWGGSMGGSVQLAQQRRWEGIPRSQLAGGIGGEVTVCTRSRREAEQGIQLRAGTSRV